jgi:membrane protein DedA with SNARE-associated domain
VWLRGCVVFQCVTALLTVNHCCVLLLLTAAGVIPFVWVAGIVFEYWLALLIVMAGSAVGMSLQYWLAR